MPVNAALYRCPSCHQDLSASGCSKCQISFPTLDGVSVLVPSPSAFLASWKNQYLSWMANLAAEKNRCDQAAKIPGILPSTKARLQKLSRACEDQQRFSKELLKPLLGDFGALSGMDEVVGGRVPLTFGLNRYEANLFRDWVWGDAENKAGLDCVLSTAGSEKADRVLVIGAGWGRLANDLCAAWAPEALLSVEYNPLCVLAGRRILSGRPLFWQEFPLAPAQVDFTTQLHEIRGQKAAKGFEWVIADFRSHPFRKGVFDRVVTPWLIDVVGEDLRVFAKRIASVLKVGGTWVEFGSLSFSHAQPAFNYSPQEVKEVLLESGFEFELETDKDLPYLRNPHSRHSRMEKVWCFRARKKKDVAEPLPYSLPEWVTDIGKPIPQLSEIASSQMAHGLWFEMLSMVDGKNSVADLSKHLQSKYRLDDARANDAVVRFLVGIVEQSSLRQVL